jgi:hypothetical protein
LRQEWHRRYFLTPLDVAKHRLQVTESAAQNPTLNNRQSVPYEGLDLIGALLLLHWLGLVSGRRLGQYFLGQ